MAAKNSTTWTITTGTVVVGQGVNSNSNSAKRDEHVYLAALKESGAGGTHFLAVLSPTEEQAMQYLANRPPGAHVLVKDSSDNLALYFKFRQAVRALVLIKAKELRKQEASIEWGRPYRPPADSATQSAHLAAQTHSTTMTPVHRIYLGNESYLKLEQCWKRFSPQVKAILLQMCSESCLNEDAKLDDWATVIATAQSPYVLTLSPHSCGFYILGTNAGTTASISNSGESNGSSSNNGNTVSVRHVEFDFQKHVMVVADGTFNPAAFIVSTHFLSKKQFEADVTFKVLRDNFLTPDRVMLKETTVGAIPAQLTTWSHCVELDSSDPEFTLLAALQSVCSKIIPHEPLPDLLLDSLRNLHLLFETSYTIDARTSSGTDWTPSIWPKEKIRMAVQIFPYLLELMVAAASGLEAIEATTNRQRNQANAALMFPKQKLKLLHQFARVMRFDMVHMMNRCDEAMIYKFAHHIFQFYLMRSDLPAEFIELVRDLLTLAPEFRVLFLKNQGANLLWKALHTGNRFQLGTSNRADKSSLAQAIMTANKAAPSPKTPHERRTSLFGLGKKVQASKARKSIDFGTTFAIPVVSAVKPLVFLRINPSLVQVELIAKLCRGQLEISHEKVELNSVGARYAFCYCRAIFRPILDKSTSDDVPKKCHRIGIYSSCKRKKRSKLSPKMCMYELVLQLALEFLSSSTAKTWDRDVGLLLRLENIHESLSNEVMQQINDATAETPKDEIALSPEHVLVETRDYCRLRVIIKCISDLFRLELKRRNQVKLAIGDKKYWYVIHVFRTELREFNDYLESRVENNGGGGGDGDGKDSSDSDEVTGDASKSNSPLKGTELLAHIAMFRWIPKALLDEWIVLSLEDLLQTANFLTSLLERTEAATSTNFEHIQYGCQLLRVFQLIMSRSTDADIRSLIVQVLSRSGSNIPSLLRHLSTAEPTYADHVDKKISNGIQTEIFAFLQAFLALDLAVSARNRSTRSSPSGIILNAEDEEELEQRKAVLMANLLTSSSGTTSDEPSLWEYIMLSLMPESCISHTASVGRSSWNSVPMLSAARSFHEHQDPPWLATFEPQYYHLLESFLLFMAQFHSSLMPDELQAHLRFEPCIESHLHYIQLYGKRYNACSSNGSSQRLRRATELHLKCLIALGSRRAYFAKITDAFLTLRALPKLLELMQEGTAQAGDARPEPVPLSKETTVLSAELSNPIDSVLPLHTLPPVEARIPEPTRAPVLSLNLNNIRRSITHLEPLPIVGTNLPKRLLFQHANVHALAIILIASVLILEPNFELDGKLCPRFVISGGSSSDESNMVSDILWHLQQQLATLKLKMKSYEAMIQDLEASYVIPTAARVSAIRSLIRLAAPSHVERALYVRASADDGTSQNESRSHLDPRPETQPVSPTDSCIYLTKGAFSTVYRATPILPRAGKVAIKVVAHQRRPGDLSVLHDLYNEVAALKKLQGEPAAVQMLDFGNHHNAQNFEVMMEYCPCTLTEWRATLHSVPFRSFLVMVLRAFEHICQSLSRIHREGVGHFDIKGDNVLIRTTPLDLTRRLLLFEEREDYESEATRFLQTSFCLGDFGESMRAVPELVESCEATISSGSLSVSDVPAPAPSPSKVRELCFFTSRTRGTEAIKSPEMLKITGGGTEKTKITFDSDIWSMGCLLYELITHELMFGNEDAAGLYTHLVISDACVLRDEHEKKITDVLSPRTEPEKLFVQRLIGLCEKILSRSSRRLSLAQLLADVRRLQEDMLEFSKSSNDKKFLEQLIASEAAAVAAETTVATREAAVISDLPSRKARWDPSEFVKDDNEHGAGGKCERAQASPFASPPSICAARFFWNLHLGAAVDASCYYLQPLMRAGAGDRATSASTTFMDAIEAEHGGRFAHFVYFLEDSDTNGRFDGEAAPIAADAAPLSLTNEISEERGRTCVYLNAAGLTLHQHALDATKFFRQVDADAQQLFPMLQRLLRDVHGRVLLLSVGRDAQAMHTAGEFAVALLLFFVQSACAVAAGDALGLLARDCAPLFGFPSTAQLLALESCSVRHADVLRRVKAEEKLARERFVVHCTCGECAFAVPVAAIRDAMYHQKQQCTRVSAAGAAGARQQRSCTCFHPFPDWQPPVADYDGYDEREQRLLFPLETRRDPVAWAEVDVRAVERLGSLFGDNCTLLSAASAALPATSRDAGSQQQQQQSMGTPPLSSRGTGTPLLLSFRELRRRRRSRRPEDSSALVGDGDGAEISGGGRDAALLIVGLKERTYGTQQQQQQAKPRRLFECELCRFPILAVSSDREKVGLPLHVARK